MFFLVGKDSIFQKPEYVLFGHNSPIIFVHINKYYDLFGQIIYLELVHIKKKMYFCGQFQIVSYAANYWMPEIHTACACHHLWPDPEQLFRTVPFRHHNGRFV